MSASRLSFTQAEQHLLSLELFGMRFGLDRMQRLMTALDSPQERFPAIHVVGTNGKSSTARMIAAILSAHGLRCGAYLSPHIGSLTERIEIEGRPVQRQQFASAIARAAQAATLVERTLEPGDKVTQFELLTAAAYSELARAGVEVGVVEAGLGGRYDATNVLRSRVQVLTNVGLEHTRWLGPTVPHIAEEKLAVVPDGGQLVAGSLDGDVSALAQAIAAQRGCSLDLAGRDFDVVADGQAISVTTAQASFGQIELRALGRFQRDNFAVAVAGAERFRGSLEPDAVRAAAASLALPGRLEPVAREPLVLLDGAHNPSGMKALAGSLDDAAEGRRTVAVVSILDDKDAAAMLAQLLPRCGNLVFTRSAHDRALSPATLQSLAGQLGGPAGEICPRPAAALRRAIELAGPGGAVLVTGSIYLLSDLAGEELARALASTAAVERGG